MILKINNSVRILIHRLKTVFSVFLQYVETMEERREGRLRVLGFSDMDTKVIKDRHWVFVSLRHGPHPTTYRE